MKEQGADIGNVAFVEKENVEDDGVTMVNDDNWNKVVLNPNKNVLLFLYAPWCTTCVNT
jgi:thioredoxin-like negative regulator of GroEL